MPGAGAAPDGLAYRPRPQGAAASTSLAPRGLPKARATALDPGLGPPLDRELAARLQPGLMGYLNELEAAFRENRMPAIRDHEHLPRVIEGLNQADPGLRLLHDVVMQHEPSSVVEDYQITQRLRQGLGRGDAWRMVIDDQDVDHRYALSVKCATTSHDASLILVDSLDAKTETSSRVTSWNDILGRIGKVLRQQMPAGLPVRLHLAVACTTIQRTPDGCSILALSAARKMAAEPGIGRIHDAALRAVANGPPGHGINALPAVLLPPSFFKHATSPKDLVVNLAQRQGSGPHGVVNPVVNKEGQTLMDRCGSHLTSRWDARAGTQRVYSNSYEAKRIELVRTALAALVQPQAPGRGTAPYEE